MDHPHIEDEAIVDRYLAGRLPQDDEAAFEEHLFACAECFAEVRAGEEMRLGLRDLAVEDATGRALAASALGAWWRSRSRSHWARQAAVAALGLVLALVSLVAVWQWTELERLRETGGETRIAADFQVVSLGVVRDAAETREIVPDPSRDAVLLSLELQSVGASSYRAELHRLGSEESAGSEGSEGLEPELLWSDDGLEPNLYDTLLVAVPAPILAPGLYRIDVTALGEQGDDGASAGAVTFRVPALGGR